MVELSSDKAKYQNLFDVLVSLGFDEQFNRESGCRSFLHSKSDTLLLFGRGSSDEVTSADILSAEVHLTGNGLIHEPLESLLQAAATCE